MTVVPFGRVKVTAPFLLTLEVVLPFTVLEVRLTVFPPPEEEDDEELLTTWASARFCEDKNTTAAQRAPTDIFMMEV